MNETYFNYNYFYSDDYEYNPDEMSPEINEHLRTINEETFDANNLSFN